MSYRCGQRTFSWYVLIIPVLCVTLLSGCRESREVSAPDAGKNDQETSDQLFSVTLGSLGEFEDFRTLLRDISTNSDTTAKRSQTIGRLNLWLSQRSDADWAKVGGVDGTVDPMAQTRVEQLSELGRMAAEVSFSLEPLRREFLLKRCSRYLRQAKETFDQNVGSPNDALQIESAFRVSISQMKAQIKEFGDEEQLENVEAFAADALIQKVGRTDAWESLTPVRKLAAALDYPDRLLDAEYLAGWLREIRTVTESTDMGLQRELYETYRQIVANLPGERRTKSAIQLEILFHAMDQLSQMGQVCSLIQFREDIDRTASELLMVRHSGIAEEQTILELAERLIHAAKRPEMAELTSAIGELCDVTRESDTADAVQLAQKLRPCAQSMDPLIAQMETYSQQSDREMYQALMAYTRQIQVIFTNVSDQLARGATTGANQASRSGAETSIPNGTAGSDDHTSIPNGALSTSDGLASQGDQFSQASTNFMTASEHFSLLATELVYYSGLNGSTFSASDDRILREAVMLRNVALWCRGEEPDDLPRVSRLFQWVFHKIASDDGRTAAALQLPRMSQFPSETLLLGRGTLAERCDLFVQLVRQIGLDAVVLGLRSDSRNEEEPWAIGVLIGEEIYLYDPELELPIPAPGEASLAFAEDGSLTVTAATLTQFLEQPEVVDRLAIDAAHPYRFRPNEPNSAQIVAFIDAAPSSLSARMRMVENRTAGDQRLQISTRPTELAQRLRSMAGIADVQLWSHPWDVRLQRVVLGDAATLQRRSLTAAFSAGAGSPLLHGRLLHLYGDFAPGEDEDAQTAVTWYRQATPTATELRALREYVAMIQDTALQTRQAAVVIALEESKQDAEFWTGQITLYRKLYRSAEDFLQRRTLSEGSNNPWYDASRELLGQVYECQKEYAKAADVYRTDTAPENWQGRFLRARWLMSLSGQEDHEPPVPGFASSGDAPIAPAQTSVPVESPNGPDGSLPGLSEETTGTLPSSTTETTGSLPGLALEPTVESAPAPVAAPSTESAELSEAKE